MLLAQMCKYLSHLIHLHPAQVTLEIMRMPLVLNLNHVRRIYNIIDTISNAGISLYLLRYPRS